MGDKSAGLRKRQQIDKTGRTMFTWVAIASAVLAISIVVSIALLERAAFNQTVIGIKNETAANLKNNNEIVEPLRDQVRLRNTDQALIDTPRPDGAEPLSVVLDALPATANSAAFGASLQKKLLSGVSIDSLRIEPIADEDSAQATPKENTVREIPFAFTVSAPSSDINKIKAIQRNLERSIRTIKVDTVTIEQRSSTVTLTVKGVGYYTSETTVELQTESITPNSKDKL